MHETPTASASPENFKSNQTLLQYQSHHFKQLKWTESVAIFVHENVNINELE